VLAREGAHGRLVHDVNGAAARAGITRGARLTDMKALVPSLHVVDADMAADAARLSALARWAQRWCPWTRVDGADGLMLETTGSDHLWGGEAAMLAQMRRAFAGLDLTARVAVAPTLGAAWALARFGACPRELCGADALAERLGPLPVAALRLDADTVLLLKRLGLKTVGAVAGVPRTALARRFRHKNELPSNPPLRLDQAFGRLAEPLMPDDVPAPVRALARFAEPVTEVEAIGPVLDGLLDDLTGQMDTRQLGARRLLLTGYRADGGSSSVEAATSRPSRDPAHLRRLFRDRLERIDTGFGLDAMTLDAVVHEALGAAQQALVGAADESIDLARLIDRLVARLGPGAVLRPVARDSHVPERAEGLAPAGTQCVIVPTGESAEGVPRPLRLLVRPEEAQVLYAVPDGPPAQLVWRRQTHRIVRSQGPERIAPEWWREKSTARLRDYYRVEDAEGRRYWIFREGLPGDGRGGPPRWFVHGLDA